jgi:hypothetical protein
MESYMVSKKKIITSVAAALLAIGMATAPAMARGGGGGGGGGFGGRGFGGRGYYAGGYGWGSPYWDDYAWDYPDDYYGGDCGYHLVPYHGHYVRRYFCG